MATEMQAKPEVGQVPHWPYVSETPGECPVCGTILRAIEDRHGSDYECPNAQCPFALSDDVNRVVDALTSDGADLVEACATALAFTFDEEAKAAVENRFAVTDRTSADWVLKKMAECTRAIQEIQAEIDAEVAAITTRGSKLLEPYRDKLQFFQAAYSEQLKAFAAEEIGEGKKRSLDLIYGRLGFRKTQGTFRFLSEGDAIDWARANDHPELLKVSPRPAEFKKLIDDEDCGPEIRNFAVVEGEAEKFYIEAALPVGKGVQ